MVFLISVIRSCYNSTMCLYCVYRHYYLISMALKQCNPICSTCLFDLPSLCNEKQKHELFSSKHLIVLWYHQMALWPHFKVNPFLTAIVFLYLSHEFDLYMFWPTYITKKLPWPTRDWNCSSIFDDHCHFSITITALLKIRNELLFLDF